MIATKTHIPARGKRIAVWYHDADASQPSNWVVTLDTIVPGLEGVAGSETLWCGDVLDDEGDARAVALREGARRGLPVVAVDPSLTGAADELLAAAPAK